MSDNTKIEWADATVNAVNGCSVLSPGCTNCYAMKLAGTRMKSHPTRAGLTQQTKAGPVWTGEVRLHEPALLQPLKWKRPRRIFWNAHGDLFHEAVPDEWVDKVFAVCALTPQHTHMILTKRAARMREYLSTRAGDWMIRWPDANPPGSLPISRHEQRLAMRGNGWPDAIVRPVFPLPNVWLGVSVEDQQRADERIPDLLATPAAVRFLSCEPLLGPVDLEEAWHGENALTSDCWGDCAWCSQGHPPLWNCQKGRQSYAEMEKDRSGIDWVIVGGESGPGARPMHPDWARSLRDQCEAAGVAFHFKQWGEWLPCEVDIPGDGSGTVCYPDDGSERDNVIPDGARRPITNLLRQDFWRVGKKRAGRLLDGREWNGFPA